MYFNYAFSELRINSHILEDTEISGPSLTDPRKDEKLFSERGLYLMK